jgi:hypothetical protein
VVSADRQGRSRRGVATLKAGSGFSLIEDYRSNGSAGELRFLAILSWDPSTQRHDGRAPEVPLQGEASPAGHHQTFSLFMSSPWFQRTP